MGKSFPIADNKYFTTHNIISFWSYFLRPNSWFCENARVLIKSIHIDNLEHTFSAMAHHMLLNLDGLACKYQYTIPLQNINSCIMSPVQFIYILTDTVWIFP